MANKSSFKEERLFAVFFSFLLFFGLIYALKTLRKVARKHKFSIYLDRGRGMVHVIAIATLHIHIFVACLTIMMLARWIH